MTNLRTAPPADRTDDPLLFMEDVVERTGIPLKTLYHYKQTRTGPPLFRVGRHLRIYASELEAWLRSKAEQ